MARVAAEEGGAWIVDGVVVGDHEAEADAGEGEGSRRRARLVLEGVGSGRQARASPYIGSWARAEGAQKRLQSVYQFLSLNFYVSFLYPRVDSIPLLIAGGGQHATTYCIQGLQTKLRRSTNRVSI
jgi:hypothetical protein